jgi:Ca-activated chloride channel family protein
MRSSAIAAAMVAVAAVCGTPVAARQDVFVTLVHTHFTVTDPQGRLVTTLGRDDVNVYDNDAAKPLADFSRHADAPVSVAVLVDRSQSVGDRLPVLASAATAFERSVLKGRDDRGLVVAFDAKVYLLQDWTNDAARLAASIERLTSAGGTSMFDAVYKTSRDKFEIGETHQNVLVLVTDGDDTTSTATFDQALEMATLSRAVIYVVGVRAEGSLNTRELQGRQVLTRLAELTGGRVFYPNANDDLSTLFGRVEEEVRSAYALTYYLDRAPDNAFHRVRIETRDKRLTVHAPTGYIARRLVDR